VSLTPNKFSPKLPHPRQSIIIVNYRFPPNPGIGGRRWAKLAKGLVSTGFKVDVVAAQPIPDGESSPWSDDINIPDLDVHFLPRTYPEYLHMRMHPLNPGFYTSLMYRLNYWVTKWKEDGAILDLAIGWEKLLSSLLLELIHDKRPEAICVTGAPFNLLYYVARLKPELSGICLIADLRDPWIESRHYGMPDLSPRRREHEISKIQLVLDSFDFVLAPNRPQLDEMKLYDRNQNGAKFVELSHFFDPDDMIAADLNPSRSVGTVRWIYGGTLYARADIHLKQLSTYLDQLQNAQPQLYEKLSIEFYTPNLEKVKYFNSHGSVVKFEKPIGKLIFEKMLAADACLLFYADYFKDAKITKFVEYLPYRKPYLYFGPRGNVLTFIEENKLGMSIEGYRDVERALLGASDFNAEFDYSEFSLSGQTEKLLQLIDR
jgi:hypothetical protein